MIACLEQQKKTHQDMTGFINEMQDLCRRVDQDVAQRKTGPQDAGMTPRAWSKNSAPRWWIT